jgi:hypothetical protein
MMKKFRAEAVAERVILLDSVEVQDRATAMYASSKPNVEVEGWVELIQQDEDGAPKTNDEGAILTETIHGMVQWHEKEEET